MDFQNQSDREAYHRGFLLGYHAGYRDGMRRTIPEPDPGSLETTPIEAMGLSSRAYNCLHQTGCSTVADVAALKEHRIIQIRNLGKKTAAEIAHALRCCGMGGTEWELFLPE